MATEALMGHGRGMVGVGGKLKKVLVSHPCPGPLDQDSGVCSVLRPASPSHRCCEWPALCHWPGPP